MAPCPGPLRDAPVGISGSSHAILVPPNLPAGRRSHRGRDGRVGGRKEGRLGVQMHAYSQQGTQGTRQPGPWTMDLVSGQGLRLGQRRESWGMERRKSRSPNAHLFPARDSGHKTAGAPGHGPGVGPRAQTGTGRGNGTGAAEGLEGDPAVCCQGPHCPGPAVPPSSGSLDGEGTAP